MRAQAGAPYLLAEAVVQEVGYLEPADFYWLLRYLPPKRRGESGTVKWVSDDFHIYGNPASSFRLTAAMKRRLRD